MNNFYTLIYLIQEWKRRLHSSYFVEALSFRKNTLSLYFQHYPTEASAQADTVYEQLTFSSDPQRTALFIDRFAQPRRANAASFFTCLEGQKLNDIQLAEADRFIEFIFEGNQRLIFLLYGSKANVLLNDDGTVAEAFKRDAILSGKAAPLPQHAVEKKIDSTDVSQIIFSRKPLLPRPVVRYYLSLHRREDSASKDGVFIADSLDKQLRSGASPHISDGYGFSILPPSLLQNEHETVFDSVNDAVAKAFYRDVIDQEFTSRKRELMKRLERAGDKLIRSLNELSRLPETLQKAAAYEETGHLLMGNPHLKSDDGTVQIEDFYNNGKIRTISVSKSINMVQNAEKYYEKAKSARLQYESSIGRITQLEQKKRLLDELLESLRSVNYKRELEKWIKNKADDLRKFGLTEGTTQQVAVPYRTIVFNEYDIKIGRSATANDELLRIAHKEDIWLHARGVSGSHVVITMNRSQGMPDKRVIEKAASYAAYFSKAKGSSLHPVIFTKRKYVRKPKGAAPGAVKVDKEEVVLVVPEEPTSIT